MGTPLRRAEPQPEPRRLLPPLPPPPPPGLSAALPGRHYCPFSLSLLAALPARPLPLGGGAGPAADVPARRRRDPRGWRGAGEGEKGGERGRVPPREERGEVPGGLGVSGGVGAAPLGSPEADRAARTPRSRGDGGAATASRV